jgi:hypothetical protein
MTSVRAGEPKDSDRATACAKSLISLTFVMLNQSPRE